MSDWPIPEMPPLVTIHTYSLEAMGSAMMGSNNPLAGCASGTWPSANRAIFVPFALTKSIVAVKMFLYNGTIVSGNVDVGLYDQFGAKIVSSGSTVQAGTSVLQEFDIADTVLGPGVFYLAAAMNNTTGTVFRANDPQGALMGGVCFQNTAFALPATATFAALAGSGIAPLMGLTTRTVV